MAYNPELDESLNRFISYSKIHAVTSGSEVLNHPISERWVAIVPRIDLLLQLIKIVIHLIITA